MQTSFNPMSQYATRTVRPQVNGLSQQTFGNTFTAQVPANLLPQLKEIKEGETVTTTAVDLLTWTRKGNTLNLKYTYLRKDPDVMLDNMEWVYPEATVNLKNGKLTLSAIKRSTDKPVSYKDKQFFTDHFIKRIHEDIDRAIEKSKMPADQRRR